MKTPQELRLAIKAARDEAHRSIDAIFDELRDKLLPDDEKPRQVSVTFNDPTDEHCQDPRNKNGHNLTPEGLEILYRLLDQGAGYNSAGRKMSITQSAVKRRKKDWEAAGGANRTKAFVHFLDTRN